MSDQKLRDLERRWKETGSPGDEAAYLLERVRVGDLSRERLELAAYCGHEGARRATNGESMPAAGDQWIGGLARWGQHVRVRALVAGANELLGSLATRFPVDFRRLEAALESALEVIRCPCTEHVRAATRSEYAAALSAAATDPESGSVENALHEWDARTRDRWTNWIAADAESAALRAASGVAQNVIDAVATRENRSITVDEVRRLSSPRLSHWALYTTSAR